MTIHLQTPIKPEDLADLKIGDVFTVSGIIITARDDAHKKALEMKKAGEKLPVDFAGNGLFHCGPIMRKTDAGWEVIAAGPTTSTRMEMFQDDFIREFRPGVIIGKGGMGDRTAAACKEYGCVYGAFTGGAALVSAQAIKEVLEVHWLDDLGMPECLWVYRVDKFPLIVGIDANGNNLFADNMEKVMKNKEKALKILGLGAE